MPAKEIRPTNLPLLRRIQDITAGAIRNQNLSMIPHETCPFYQTFTLVIQFGIPNDKIPLKATSNLVLQIC